MGDTKFTVDGRSIRSWTGLFTVISIAALLGSWLSVIIRGDEQIKRNTTEIEDIRKLITVEQTSRYELKETLARVEERVNAIYHKVYSNSDRK